MLIFHQMNIFLHKNNLANDESLQYVILTTLCKQNHSSIVFLIQNVKMTSQLLGKRQGHFVALLIWASTMASIAFGS